MVSVESDNDREGSRLTKTDLLRPSLANQPTEHNSIPLSLSFSFYFPLLFLLTIRNSR